MTIRHAFCSIRINYCKFAFSFVIHTLFGLTSLDALQEQIVQQLLALTNIKGLEHAAQFGKTLVLTVLKCLKLEAVTESIKFQHLLKVSDVVICLDDMERKSDSLNTKELMGFINGLVEHDKMKVILIANEQEIDPPIYHDWKEKVISRVVAYKLDLADVLPRLLETSFENRVHYREFILKQQDDLLTVFPHSKNNLRTLLFFLERFQPIYDNYLTHHKRLKGPKTMGYDQMLNSIFWFCLAISFEFQNGTLSFYDRKQIDQTGPDLSDPAYLRLFGLTEDTPQENKPSVKSILLEKYYAGRIFTFYSSVYDYVTGGSTFEYPALEAELKKAYYINDDAAEPHYELFNELAPPQYKNLPNRDYLIKTRQLVQHAAAGQYAHYHYISILHFILRDYNPLHYKPERLLVLLKKGIRKSRPQAKYAAGLDKYLDISVLIYHPQHFLKLKEFILDFNKQLLLEQIKEEALSLEKLFVEDRDSFFHKLSDLDQPLHSQPVFAFFNANVFYGQLRQFNRGQLERMTSFFFRRYFPNPHELLKIEEGFLQALQGRLAPMRAQRIGFANYLYLELDKQLENALNQLAALP